MLTVKLTAMGYGKYAVIVMYCSGESHYGKL